MNEKKHIKLTVEIVNGDETDLQILIGAINCQISDGFSGQEGGWITGIKYRWNLETSPIITAKPEPVNR